MATIDLADLVTDEGEEVEPVVLRFGKREHTLPAHVPAAFIAALGEVAWAKQVDSDVDQRRANLKLVAAIADAVGPFADGSVPTGVLYRAMMQAYQLGEASASSD